MRYRFFFFAAILFMGNGIANAQEKWDLKKCVDYAMQNNLTVKQTSLQENFSSLALNQNKMARFPNAAFSTNGGYSIGSVQDASFNVVTGGSYFVNSGLQTSVDIFNWFSKKNTVAASEWELAAAKANTDKLRNDIALSTANLYLQVLLNKEQAEIASVQLEQTRAQLSNTRKLVNAGSLPELNAAELEAQFANDSANLITAKGNITQSLLSLKAYMSLDAAAPFDIETPPVNKIPVETIENLQPEAVYASAVVNLPQQRFNDMKLKAAAKNIEAAKGNMYPTFSLFANLNSGFNDKTFVLKGYDFLPADPVQIGTVAVNGTTYNVNSLGLKQVPITAKRGFFPQFSDNFRQSYGLNISVPILNGGMLKTAYKRSQVTMKSLEIQKDIDNQKLKQDIYQAYNAAMVALEKFNASEKNVTASQRSYDFSQKRYDVGMLGTFELITNQNNLLRAKLQNVLNQFDYVFKMKVLEFYKGQGIKL
ncbi:MAG: TolC family protein [Ferruginibacter sp.]